MAMLVQEERTKPRHLVGNGDVTEAPRREPPSGVEIDFKVGYLRSQLLKKDPARVDRKGTLSLYISENPFKVAILCLVALSILTLAIVENKGESPSLLCAQPSSQSSDAYTLPNVNFETVEAVKDTGRFRVVKANKWIIIAASGPPTEANLAMVKILGWQVLAVGDSDTPSDWDVRGAIFLSVEQQASLGFRVLAHLPYASYVRKSVGYLFAIQHGATVIYDGDENAFVLGGDLGNIFDLDPSDSRKESILQFLPLQNRTIVNPYVHFGQRSVWPRGLPLGSIVNINPEIYYGQVPAGKQFIQQGLANGLPDVDSIFYYTRKGESQSFDIRFDSHAPPVALPRGTMAPINHFNTLFHYPAFWALMLPVSRNPTVSDVFRGFWGQRLLWEIGGYIAIYPPSIYRPDIKKHHALTDEKDLNENVERLIIFLVAWTSEKRTFFDRVLDLSHAMAEAGFWTTQDVDYTAAWLQDLVSVGYSQPSLSALEVGMGASLVGQAEHVEFVPLALPSAHLGVEEKSMVGFEVGNLLRWKGFYGNIVLIMECTWPVNKTALGWRMLYGRMFRSVVLLSNQSDARFGVKANEDWQTFKIYSEIFERYPNAEGFLFLKDNAILNYWNLLLANKTRLWNLHKAREAWKVVGHDHRNGSEWYYKSSIKRTVKKMVASLPIHFQITYKENMGDAQFVVSMSEVFYIPQRLVSDFVELVPLAVQAKLHPDLALPLFFLAMEHVEDFDSDAFSRVLYETGPGAAGSYTADAHVVRHPFPVRNQQELLHWIKSMALGDPLLLEAL